MKVKTNNTTIWFWSLYTFTGFAMLVIGLIGKFEGDKLFVLVGGMQIGFGASSGLILLTRFIVNWRNSKRNELR